MQALRVGVAVEPLVVPRYGRGAQTPALAQDVGRWSRAPTVAPSLEVLGRLGAAALDALPQAGGGDGGEGEEHAKGDAKAPNGLDLVARGLVSVDPLEGVVAGVVDVVEERVNEGGRVALGGEVFAGEVADGLADDAGYDDDCNQNEGVCAGGNEEREELVPVEDVCDDDVEGRETSLDSVSAGLARQKQFQLTTTSVPTRAEGAA